MNVFSLAGPERADSGAPDLLPHANAEPARAHSFGQILASAVDAASSAVESADGLAAAVAAGSGNVVQASIARAKADVLLEVVSVSAARISGALNGLLQTQV